MSGCGCRCHLPHWSACICLYCFVQYRSKSFYFVPSCADLREVRLWTFLIVCAFVPMFFFFILFANKKQFKLEGQSDEWRAEIVGAYPPSLVPNSSNRSVNASLNSIIPWAGIAICDRGPPRVIVWDTYEAKAHWISCVWAFARWTAALLLTLKNRPRVFSFRSK